MVTYSAVILFKIFGRTILPRPWPIRPSALNPSPESRLIGHGRDWNSGWAKNLTIKHERNMKITPIPRLIPNLSRIKLKNLVDSVRYVYQKTQ
jgi:hypothetical protein